MRLLRIFAFAALASTVGCVHAPHLSPLDEREGPWQPGRAAPPVVRVGEPLGLRVAERAQGLVDRDGSLVRRDCSGLVETVFSDLGLRLPVADDVASNAVAREYTAFDREGALVIDHPLPGDLAFFHDTYDRNHNGRLDDPLTHVAIVAEVDVDGTLTLVHFGSHGVATFKMNLDQLHDAHDLAGRRVNDRLRVQKRHDQPHTPYLASELFIAFGRAPEQRGAVARR